MSLLSLHRLLATAVVLIALSTGLFVLSAEPALAITTPVGEYRASRSATAPNNLIGIEAWLSEEAVRDNIALGYDIASDDAVAARGTTTLYRSVSAAEHADIAASGVLRAGPNSFSTGKWFWDSAESAAKFGSKMDGPGNFRVIEATFPRSAADQFRQSCG